MTVSQETSLPPSAATSLAQRYPAADTPQGTASTPVIEALLRHRTVRAFTAQALPPHTVETLVAAAQSAPTSSNLQTWSVVAVTDPERKSRLAGFAANQGFIRQAPLFLCFIADLSRLERLGEAQGQKLEGLEYQESFTMAAIDAALAAQNAVVAGESLGLGSCFVGAIRNKPAEVAAELGLPPNSVVVFGMAVGYPDPAESSGIKPRLPQAVVLHREQYGTAGEAAGIARYDQAMIGFSQRYMHSNEGWIDRVIRRVATPQSLSGRDKFAEILRRLGFSLR